jgi:hypothetical protein
MLTVFATLSCQAISSAHCPAASAPKLLPITLPRVIPSGETKKPNRAATLSYRMKYSRWFPVVRYLESSTSTPVGAVSK